MFVGEAPGFYEDQQREPFVGPTGDLLWSICSELGLYKRDVYVTNVLKYRPPNNKLQRYEETGHTVKEGVEQLWEEINAIKPNCILALGNLSLYATTGRGTGSKGISEWRGSILPSSSMDYKVVPTIHPAALLHSLKEEGSEGEDVHGAMGWKWRKVIKLDIARAMEESQERRYNPPDRLLEVCKDPVTLQRFFDKYADKKVVSVDIEVIYAIPVCISFAFNNWHAISVPLLNVYSWQNLDGITAHTLAAIWAIISEFLARPDIQIIGQNFKFDQNQLERTCGIRCANVWLDVMLLFHGIYPEYPKSLAFMTSILTREPYYKLEGKEFNWKKDKIEKLLLYNAKDAAVTFEVYEELMKEVEQFIVPGFPDWINEYFFGFVMHLHQLYRDIDNAGIPINPVRQKELTKEYKQKVINAQAELDAIAGCHVNVSSSKQVGILLFRQFKLPWRKSCKESVLVALEANTARKPEVKRALALIVHIRRLRKSINTYFEARPDYDGLMRTSYQIAGTETGRSSTKLLKAPVRPTKVGLAFQTMTKHGDVGVELRSYFVPNVVGKEEEYDFVEFDMSQAEARLVALLGEDNITLKLFESGADIHKLTASWLFDKPENLISEEERFVGKTVRHAGSYGMGKHRLMEIVNTRAKKFHIDINISEWRAGKILDRFHNYSPNIRGVYHEKVRQALQDNNMMLVNPFGRPRIFNDRWGEELFKEAYAHIPQSTVPDALRLACLRAKKRLEAAGLVSGTDFIWVIEAHDGILGRVRKGHVSTYISILREEMERPIDFTRCTLKAGEIVIPAECSVSSVSYKDLKKIKLAA